MIRHLSHSSIQEFLACPRRFEWRRVRGLRKARKAEALRFGDHYHHGLDRLKKGHDVETVVAEIWGSYRDVPAWVHDLDPWLLEREICVRLLIAWNVFTEPLDVVASEMPFEARIRNPATGRTTRRFRLRGIVDGWIRLGDGRLALLEHKTTSQEIEAHSDFLRRLRVDSQISRYLLAARELGLETGTMVYDLTRKPTIRPRRLKKKEIAELRADGVYCGQPILEIPASLERETPEMFGARLTADLVERPERYFRRLEVARLDRDLEEEARELWLQQQAVARALRSGSFFRNTSACLSPYRCEFADLCLSGVRPAGLEPGEVPEGFETSLPKERTTP